MVSNALAGFATGFFGNLAAENEKKDKEKAQQDAIYQKTLLEYNASKALQDARLQAEDIQKKRELAAKYPQGTPNAEALYSQFKAQTPATTPTTAPVATPMPLPAESDNTPITPSTPVVQVATSQGNPQEATAPETGASVTGGPVDTSVTPTQETIPVATPQVNTQTNPTEVAPAPLPFGSRHPETAVIAKSMIETAMASGSDINPMEFHKFIADYDQQLDKAKAAPDLTSYGPADLTVIGAQQKLGLIKDVKDIKPLTPRATNDVNKLVVAASSQKLAAQQGINTVNSMLGMGNDVLSGPWADVEAKVRAGLSKLTDRQVDDAVNNSYVAGKDLVQFANANFKSLGGGRPGIGLLNLEKEGSPNINMPRQAKEDVLLQYLANYKAVVNHSSALIAGPDNLSVQQRVKYADKIDEINPSITGNGKTLNPDFMDYIDLEDAIANGTFKPGMTGSNVRNSMGQLDKSSDTPQGITSEGATKDNKPKNDPLGLF